MKKRGIMLALLALFLCTTSVAFAVTTITEVCPDLMQDPYPTMLHKGNQLHLICSHYIEPDLYDLEAEGITEYHCFALTEDNTFIPCTSGCQTIWDNVQVMTYGGMRDAYHLLDYEGRVYRWQPEAEKPWEEIIQLDFASHGYDLHNNSKDLGNGWMQSLFDVSFLDDALYLIDYEKKLLYAISLEDGSWATLLTGNQAGRVIARNGVQMLVDCGTIRCYHSDTGELCSFRFGYPELPLLLTADGHGAWVLVTFNSIFTIDTDGHETRVYSFPTGVRPLRCVVTRGDQLFYLTQANETVYWNLTNIHDDVQNQQYLTIAGNQYVFDTMNQYLPETIGFFAAHQDVNIRMAEQGNEEEEIAKQLIVGTQAFDIMSLDTSSANLSSIASKGYFFDLAEQPAIAAYMATLRPIWRDACVVNDQVVALPVCATASAIVRARDAWDELGLGDPPTTWSALFDLIEWCEEEGVLGDYRLFGVSGSRVPTYERLLWKLLYQWAAARARQGETLTFQQPELLALLDRLQALRPLLDAQDATVGGVPLLWDDVAVTEVHLMFTHYTDAEVEPLVLGFTGEADRAIPASLTVLVVNPYSQHCALAADYLGYLAERPMPYAQCVLLDGQPEGIVNPATEEEAQRHATYVEELAQAMEQARAEGDMDAVLSLQSMLDAQKVYYDSYWYVTPEAAANYDEVVPYLVMLDSEHGVDVFDHGEKAINAFLEGGMDAQTMVKQLDRVLEMQRMENQ